MTTLLTCHGAVPLADAGENGEVEDIDMGHLSGLWLPLPSFPLTTRSNKFEERRFDMRPCTVTLADRFVPFVPSSHLHQLPHRRENVVFKDSLEGALRVFY